MIVAPNIVVNYLLFLRLRCVNVHALLLPRILYSFILSFFLHNFDTLAIPELHIYQLLILVYKCLYHKHLLPTAFANYFTINSAVHLYNTRVRENLQ